MAHTTPPLASVRVIESSLLGPGAITMHLADLGAEVIKVESPSGDYVREMTWPIINGVSLFHLHIHRGKKSIVLDLRKEEGVQIYLELVQARRRRDRSHAARLARETRPWVRATAVGESTDRVLQHLRVRHDRPVQGSARARHRLRHLGGAGQSRVRRRRVLLHPGTRRRWACTRGRCSARSAVLAGVIRARETGEGCMMEIGQSDAAAYMDWYRSETWKAYERPESEVTGNKADNYERRAPGTAGMKEGVRYQIYESADGHVLFMASEQAFWKNFCAGVGRLDLFEKWPGSKYADHARGNRELQRELRDDLQDQDLGRVDRVRHQAQHTDRAGEHAEDHCQRPAVPGALPVVPGRQARRRHAALSGEAHRRSSSRSRPWRRRSASTPRRCSPRCWATTRTRSPRCARPVPWVEDSALLPARLTTSSGSVATSQSGGR